MNAWGPGRLRSGILAFVSAFLTGGFLIAVGSASWLTYGVGGYLALVVLALFVPPAVTAQVVGGQTLMAGLLVGPEGPAPLLLVPAVFGVVVTAEMLADVARMDTPFESHPRHDLLRSGVSALIGGGVFAAVALVGTLPGPEGIGAVVLASGICVVLALVLVREQT